jgi:hypothetical protein
MDEPSGKTASSTSSSPMKYEIRRTKATNAKTLDLALTMFRQRQVKVIDFWPDVDRGEWVFKILKNREN